MKTDPREYQLALQIEEAKAQRKYDLVKELTQELIALQQTYPTPKPPSDDLLVRKYGVRRALLEQERELAAQLAEAKDGEQQNQLRDKLVEVQKEQPTNFGPTFGWQTLTK